jgi:hypothetical protein
MERPKWGWRILHFEELRDLYTQSSEIKADETDWTWNWETRNTYKRFVMKCLEGSHLEDFFIIRGVGLM